MPTPCSNADEVQRLTDRLSSHKLKRDPNAPLLVALPAKNVIQFRPPTDKELAEIRQDEARLAAKKAKWEASRRQTHGNDPYRAATAGFPRIPTPSYTPFTPPPVGL